MGRARWVDLPTQCHLGGMGQHFEPTNLSRHRQSEKGRPTSPCMHIFSQHISFICNTCPSIFLLPFLHSFFWSFSLLRLKFTLYSSPNPFGNILNFPSCIVFTDTFKPLTLLLWQALINPRRHHHIHLTWKSKGLKHSFHLYFLFYSPLARLAHSSLSSLFSLYENHRKELMHPIALFSIVSYIFTFLNPFGNDYHCPPYALFSPMVSSLRCGYSNKS